jgi:hypothetical protein
MPRISYCKSYYMPNYYQFMMSSGWVLFPESVRVPAHQLLHPGGLRLHQSSRCTNRICNVLMPNPIRFFMFCIRICIRIQLQFLIKKRFFRCTGYFFLLQVLVIKKLDPDPDLLKMLYPNLYLYLIHNTDFNADPDPVGSESFCRIHFYQI